MKSSPTTSLRRLSVFALLCPLCFLISPFILVFGGSQNVIFSNRVGAEILMFFIIGLLPTLQVIYTLNTRRFLRLRPDLPETVAPVDRGAHGATAETELVGPSLAMRVIVIMCSLVLCLIIGLITAQYYITLVLREMSGFNWEGIVSEGYQFPVFLLLVNLSYLTAVPTLIYNIRTSTMKWVKEPAPGEAAPVSAL